MSIEGVVEARNGTGVKIDGEWRNVSKFHPVELPEVGAHVRADVDNKGFLKEIQVLDGESPAVSSARDERITRLAVLKAAANFAAIRSDIKSADVLRIADKWLEWVLKENDAG